jgi:hypothetical protein
LLGEAHQGKDNSFLTLLEDEPGLLGGQLRTEQGWQGSRIQGARRRRSHGNSEMSRPADCKIN